jgi:hypothetical protein
MTLLFDDLKEKEIWASFDPAAESAKAVANQGKK